jgi:hypothetical protein
MAPRLLTVGVAVQVDAAARDAGAVNGDFFTHGDFAAASDAAGRLRDTLRG